MRSFVSAVFMAMIYILPCFGQLNTLHNCPRPGDVLIKQQVEYIEPGASGADRLWDFSRLKSVNDDYTLRYTLPPLEGDSIYLLGNKRYSRNTTGANELIVGTEHNTMYYYRLVNDSLLQLGHENPSVLLEYTHPMMLMHFPLNYGLTVFSNYKSEGLYSGTVDIHTQGTVITTADAYGKMILPSGDTISPVLRVKMIQTISAKDAADTTPHTDKQLETFRWYSKGYRYPIVEVIRSTATADTIAVFSTAFYYPPQEQLYLDADPVNQTLLDELWEKIENNIEGVKNRPVKAVIPEDIISCKIYPNPVESTLYLEYELKEDVEVSFDLYSTNGTPIRKIAPKSKVRGIYLETLDCSSLSPQSYALRVTANGVFMNRIIIKK